MREPDVTLSLTPSLTPYVPYSTASVLMLPCQKGRVPRWRVPLWWTKTIKVVREVRSDFIVSPLNRRMFALRCLFLCNIIQVRVCCQAWSVMNLLKCPKQVSEEQHPCWSGQASLDCRWYIPLMRRCCFRSWSPSWGGVCVAKQELSLLWLNEQ